jgi:protein-disulfide isomerase
MENGDRHLNQWVDEHIARLDASPAWHPDPERGLAGVRRKDRSVRRRRWGLSVAGLGALASALFTIPGCQAATCQVQSDNLAERLWKSVFVPKPPEPRPQPQSQTESQPPTPVFVPPPEAIPAPEPPRSKRAAAPPRSFKETGSPTAAITCEIYTDYECPACARMYLEVVPQLMADYVATGKVKLRHRDYPLSYHQYSRLAARYANAAGVAGKYDIAVTQLFRTQSSWGMTGDIDSQLAQILPSDVMAKVRDLVHSDPHLDDSVRTDFEQGRADQITRTPSAVLVVNGERRLLGTGDYAMLKAALDDFLRNR